MNELWVARDLRIGSHAYLYRTKPRDAGMCFQPVDGVMFDVDSEAFPDLKPGQCRRLVLAEETSE